MKLACLPRMMPFSVEGPCDAVWDMSVGLVLSRTKLPHLHLCISCPQAWSVSIHPPVYPLLPKLDCTELCWGQSLWHVFLECIEGITTVITKILPKKTQYNLACSEILAEIALWFQVLSWIGSRFWWISTGSGLSDSKAGNGWLWHPAQAQMAASHLCLDTSSKKEDRIWRKKCHPELHNLQISGPRNRPWCWGSP